MTNPQSSPESPVIESEKQACDLEFFSRANVFAQNAIEQIPELQAVAIIPLWAPQLDGVPAGLLRLRDESPPYIAGLLQMLGRLAAFGVDVHRDMFTQIKAFDNMASNMVAEIRARQEELQKLQQLAENNATEQQ
jgi:hypothetical protein